MRTVKSAERTLALFELFSKRQRALTVGRIAAELKMPQASTSMLLSNLRELGYVTYDREARTYTPTIRVALLGSWISQQFDDAGSLTTNLRLLQGSVEERVFIGIQNGAHAQYIFAIDGRHSSQVVTGQVRLMTRSAVGRALLSLKSDQEVLRLVHRCNAEATESRQRVVPSEYLALVEQVRVCGYAETRGDIMPTFGAFAVTVQAPMEFMPVAIGVGLPIERIARKKPRIIAALAELQKSFASASGADPAYDALPPTRSAA